MALRRPPTTFSDEINAADLAANSVGASELADNAVDTAAIADDAVTNAKVGASAIGATELASNAVTTAKITDANITAAKVASSAITKEKIAAEAIEVKPHIKYGMLYPAIKDSGGTPRQVDNVTAVVASTTGPAGSTVVSSLYGTVQSDGRMYYHTDIKGSKPIKDPRIGAHFGSQRYKFRSIQKLEQESATHGKSVYSIDGREFIRVLDDSTKVAVLNGNHGNFIQIADSPANCFIEVVGYLNNLNLSLVTDTNRCTEVDISIDGVVVVDGSSTLGGDTTASSPLMSRYVDTGSLINTGITSTLGIHTAKIECKASGHFPISGIELIAQDEFTDATCDYNNDPTITHDANTRIVAGMSVTGTGIPANATVASVTSTTAFELSASTTGGAVTNGTLTFGTNNIQIPGQNVVSYGKKFAVSAAVQHYNPFNGMTGANNLAALGAYIDTATSLGMENWKGGTANYYKPFNGGRVVKWVDSSGVIKTSVNMMPPNAQNINTTASNAFSDGEVQAGTNDHTITFNGSAVDHSLSEVAKTFHWREFGNGSANAGTESGTYPDVSMLSGTADNIAYVMDDGLTSFSGQGVKNNSGPLLPNATNDHYFITFIGTGIGYIEDVTQNKSATVAQNLPYGTHILKVLRDADTTPDLTIDGFAITDVSGSLPTTGEINQITFHQPKMPSIPEDACILADYMLMADFVANTTAAKENISKGIRYQDCSRDIFCDAGSTLTLYQADLAGAGGFVIDSGTNSNVKFKLPFFGNAIEQQWHNHATYAISTGTMKMDGAALTTSSHPNLVATTAGTSSFASGTGVLTYEQGTIQGQNASFKGLDLKTQTFEINSIASLSGNARFRVRSFGVATPTHTSSHYQEFETPFLKELVGGDRNMEQNNLIVTPDGKSWDEVTRDTSYLSNMRFQAASGASDMNSTQVYFPDDLRGRQGTRDLGNKDFAIAYDRLICLVDGVYCVGIRGYSNALVSSEIKINGTLALQHNLGAGSGGQNFNPEVTVHLKRGDYIQWNSPYNSGNYGDWWVWKI